MTNSAFDSGYKPISAMKPWQEAARVNALQEMARTAQMGLGGADWEDMEAKAASDASAVKRHAAQMQAAEALKQAPGLLAGLIGRTLWRTPAAKVA